MNTQLAPGTGPRAASRQPPVPFTADLGGGVLLCVEPRREIAWDLFAATASDNSVALDGYVKGPTRYDPVRRLANFNHHDGVDRLSTRCTSEQVWLALTMDLLQQFTATDTHPLRVWVNDGDQDVCLATWELANHERISGGKSDPLINRLVRMEDLFDTTAGAYRVDPKQQIVREMAWIFQPYTQARVGGELFRMEGGAIANLVVTVHERITRHTLGRGQALDLDDRFERLGGGAHWWMVREVGDHARTGLFHEGCRAFVSLVSEEGSAYRYSIGKSSPFVPFPVTAIMDRLNVVEGYGTSDVKPWGGSNTIGGCLRELPSSLSPRELEGEINRLLAAAAG